MNLIINSISIISFETKKAKRQEFIKGINVVTSSGSVGGNWVGKSSLLRSIFHTLGADGIFSSKWEQEGPYIYLLDFNIDNVNYLMLRKDSLFKLFDFNKKQIFSVSDRNKLSEELVTLFNQKIYLKTHNGTYKLAHPAYNYLFNYIEQTRIFPTSFQSFNYLSAFSDYYDDLIYSHLGVHNERSNLLNQEHKELSIKIKEFEDREKTLTEINKEIETSDGFILDFNLLKNKLEFHEDRYRKLSNQVNKHKKNLNDAYNSKVELENLLKEIDELILGEKTNIKKELKAHKCPYCENDIQDDQSYYFHRVKHIDGYEIQKLSVENHLNQINKKIELESDSYKDILKEIQNVEKEIFNGSKEIKDGLKAIGLKEITTNVITQIGEVRSKINHARERIKEIKKELREIQKKKSEVDKKYNLTFNDILLKYPINGIESNSIQKASKKIKVDGTHNNIVTVAWLCSLLKTKYEFNPTAVRYPLIFDTPNNANFDENNEQKIFELIFDNLPKGGQIITSLVGFKKEKYKNYNVNEIILTNEEYNLLNNEDYIECNKIYNYLGIFV